MAYGRFSERAQVVIMNAQKESNKFRHGYIGTEHILLGIITEGGYSGEVLSNYGVSVTTVRKIVDDYLGYGESTDMSKDELLLTPRTKRLFDESFNKAKKFDHKSVSPEHILLALVCEDEGVANTILSQLKIDFKNIKDELTIYLSNKNEEEYRKSAEKNNIESKTPALNQYGSDITRQAIEGKLDPVIGRDKETQRVLEILCRRIKNNPCLIGEPGVGKTAVVEGLAQKIVEGNVPEILRDKRLICLDISSMIAGAKYRGEFEDRLKRVMKEIKENKKVIVFIDEIHTIIGAGGAEGAIDAANILKPVLARGEIQCIGATTIDEYRKYIAKESALERRFQPVTVDEPNKEDTLSILKGLRDRYESHHRVKITDDALKAAVDLADRYITDRFMPDKAIDLIDEASAKVRIENLTTPPQLKENENEIYNTIKEKEDAIIVQDFEKAAVLRDTEKVLQEKLEELKKEWVEQSSSQLLIVDKEKVAAVVSLWAKVPVEKLNEKESERLLYLEDTLSKRVVGQNEAIKSISRAIRRARVGLKDPNRPIGTFIFLGPTGVGKTELCKALADSMFSNENSIVRIDMSEYMERHSTSKLIGSPPGYIGYEDGGQLTEAVRRNPYSVVLLDEIEKANPEVFNILLQIMEDGRLTDGKGKVVNFKNTIIIMTSNVGAHTIKKDKAMGFAVNINRDSEYERMKENIMEELKKTFSPEFLNRIDDTIVFQKLNEEDMVSIIDLMLKNINERLEDNEIYLDFNEESKRFLISKGSDLSYGARPLRRTITKEVEDILSEEMLKGAVSPGDKLKVTVDDRKLKFIRF